MDEVKDPPPQTPTPQPAAPESTSGPESKPTPPEPPIASSENPPPTTPPTIPEQVAPPPPVSPPPATPQPPPEQVAPPVSPPLSGKKILLVDDDASFLELYASVFGSAGFNYSVAQTGTEALEKAKAERPDLILLDIMMPDTNGLEILKKLKQDPDTAAIAVWMITNLAEQIDQETAASLGATNYLVKSTFTPKQVCEKINTYFASGTTNP